MPCALKLLGGPFKLPDVKATSLFQRPSLFPKQSFGLLRTQKQGRETRCFGEIMNARAVLPHAENDVQ